MTDWLTEAVEEVTNVAFPFDPTGGLKGFKEKLRAVFDKHCPFKVDVAYMPVPRCESCKLWTPRVDLDAGQCGLREHPDAKLWPEMYDGIVTTADFGCVQWEAKS